MKVVKCCGKKRTSKFCPECGKELGGSPLYGLLAHCRKIRSQYARWVKELEDRVASSNAQSKEKVQGWLTAKRRKLEQWASWVDTLSELLDAQSSGSA